MFELRANLPSELQER